eukprot:38001_1
MEELIQFKLNVDSLSSKQFMVFIESVGKHKMASIMFQYFHNQLQNSTDINDLRHNVIPSIQNINQSIAQIIELGSTDDIQTNEINYCNHFHKLPDVLISKISSLLDMNSILSFEMCSRTIFIATRTPLSLHEIDQDRLQQIIKVYNSKNFIYKLLRFQCIKEISVQMDHCYEWHNFHYDKTTRTISNDYPPDVKYLFPPILCKNVETFIIAGSDKLYKKQYINEFLHAFQFCNFPNVTTFRFMDTSPRKLTSLETNDLDNIMSFFYNKFPNMKYFEFCCYKYRQSVFSNSNWCHKLKGICWTCEESNYFKDMLKQIGNNLESYHHGSSTDKWSAYHTFDNLKEICLCDTEQSMLIFLAKQQMHNLE